MNLSMIDMKNRIQFHDSLELLYHQMVRSLSRVSLCRGWGPTFIFLSCYGVFAWARSGPVLRCAIHDENYYWSERLTPASCLGQVHVERGKAIALAAVVFRLVCWS